MPRFRYRSGSGWADSALSGAVPFNGERIAFGPPTGGGTIDEFLAFPNPLTSADWSDDNTNVAVRFGVTIPGQFVGVRFWRPATDQGAIERVYGCNHDANLVIAAPTVVAGGIRGAYVEQLFDTPADILPGVNYFAAYHTNRYGFSRVVDGATPPFSSAHIYTDPTMAGTAWYAFGTAGNVPNTPSANFHYNVSPIVRFPA